MKINLPISPEGVLEGGLPPVSPSFRRSIRGMNSLSLISAQGEEKEEGEREVRRERKKEKEKEKKKER